MAAVWADVQLIVWRISRHAARLASGGEVPNAWGVVDASRDEVLAIRCEPRVARGRIVHGLHGDLATVDVPHLYATLQACRCQQRAVWTEAHSIDALALTV